MFENHWPEAQVLRVPHFCSLLFPGGVGAARGEIREVPFLPSCSPQIVAAPLIFWRNGTPLFLPIDPSCLFLYGTHPHLQAELLLCLLVTFCLRLVE